MNLKILVFPCGSEIGLEIHRALSSSKEITLYGGASVSDHGEFAYQNFIPNIPFVSEGNFLAELNRVIETYSIDYVLPAHDSVVLKLAKAVENGELSCKLATSPYETCRICCSKKATHKAFSELLRTPHLYESIEDVKEWPVFLKPDVGCGSRGTARCLSLTEANYRLSKAHDLLIFEYLPGKEYTVDCFTDRNGNMLFCGGRERSRIANGISVRTSPVMDKSFREIAEIINKRLKFRGMWFFQVKEAKNGELALMEVAPRIAGAMGLYRNLGINFALMTLYDMEGFDVQVIGNDYPIVFDRALGSRYRIGLKYKAAYLDWDDCVVLNGKINLTVVAFIYQCLNNSVAVHLLTRHKGDLATALSRYRLAQVFSSIIQIPDNTPKSVFIKESSSVFIDDSFAERAEVKRNAGIQVFAPDAVESLLGS